MKQKWSRGLALAVFACVSLAFAAEKSTSAVKRLLDPQTRAQAFFELSSFGTKETFEEFTAHLAELDAIECPQAKGPPLYLVTHMPFWSVSESFLSPDDYVISKPRELFGMRKGERIVGAADRLAEAVINGFKADGSKFTPFNGDNMMTNGYLLDINGDGIVEKIDTTRMSVEGARDDVIEVLCIDTAELTSRQLFAVCMNWHPRDADKPANRWAWKLARNPETRIFEIVLYPEEGDERKPVAVFRWDASTRSFAGPSGGHGSHFAVLAPGKEAWKSLRDIQAQGGLGYSVTARGPDVAAKFIEDDGQTPAPPEPNAYVSESRKALSHEELLKFMMPGRSVSDYQMEFRPETHIPAEFWKMAPKEAALAIAEGSRTRSHRAKYALVVDDRDGVAPPESGSLSLVHHSSACYSARSWNFQINFAADESWLVFARTTIAGAALYSPLRDEHSYVFQRHEIAPEDARHLAQTIWWLDRVRSRERVLGGSTHGGSGRFSTADGNATLSLRDLGSRQLVDLEGTIFSEPIPLRWNENYNRTTALNLAVYLIEVTLPERWNQKGLWFRDESVPWRDITDQQRKEARAKLARSLQTSVRSFLGKVIESNGASRFDPQLVDLAIQAIGDFRLPLTDELNALERLCKPPSKDEEEYRSLLQKIETHPSPPGSETTPDQKRLYELEGELKNDLSFTIRNHLPLARRQLADGNDPAALQAWVESEQSDTTWALHRLHDLAPQLAVDFLARKLLALKQPEQAELATRMFEDIVSVSPDRARALMPKLAPTLRVACAALLPGEEGAQNPQALLAVLGDKKQNFRARYDALAALAPDKQPMKFSQPAINETLIALVKTESGFQSIAGSCASALCSRDGAEDHWTELVAFNNRDTKDIRADCLDGLAGIVSRTADDSMRKDLSRLLQQHLGETSLFVTTVFDAVFAADLRELRRDLERMATHHGSDIEGKEAHMSNGKARKIDSRYHRARHILAVWDEQDATTRAKLLVAWRVGQRRQAWAYGRPAFARRYDALLQSALSDPRTDQKSVAQFIDWCLMHADAALPEPLDAEDRAWLEGLVR